MQTLQTNFKALIPAGSTVVLGLSGGPDSVFLLNQLVTLQKNYNFQIIAAHLDHEWHSNSHQAREFCAKLCLELGIDFQSKQKLIFVAKTISQLDFKPKQTGSQEDLGRQYRRYFFEQLAAEYTPAKIWLAHHLDDQIETFILRLIRGASLTGLTGIKTHNGLYIHPLLQLTKLDILNYLETNKINYFIDPTNSSLDYLRNKIRQTVLPALYQADPRFQQNFTRSLTKLQDSELFITQNTHKIYQKIITSEYQLDLNKFKTLENYLQTRVLLHWLCQAGVKFTVSEKFLAEILRFLQHPNPTKSHQLGTWQISKKSGLAQISSD